MHIMVTFLSTRISDDYTIFKDWKHFEVGVIYCFFHHLPPQYLAFSIYEHMQVQTVARVGWASKCVHNECLFDNNFG